MPTAAAAPGGRRGARLGQHGRQAARKITGLEAVLFDHDAMAIAALDPGDGRAVTAKVAGIAADRVAAICTRYTSALTAAARDEP